MVKADFVSFVAARGTAGFLRSPFPFTRLDTRLARLKTLNFLYRKTCTFYEYRYDKMDDLSQRWRLSDFLGNRDFAMPRALSP